MSECYGKFGLKIRPPQCNGEACDVCAPAMNKIKADRFPAPHMTPPRTRRAKYAKKTKPRRR